MYRAARDCEVRRDPDKWHNREHEKTSLTQMPD